MKNEIFADIEFILKDFGTVVFLGDPVLVNYIGIRYKTKKQAVLDRLKKSRWEVIIVYEHDEDLSLIHI